MQDDPDDEDGDGTIKYQCRRCCQAEPNLLATRSVSLVCHHSPNWEAKYWASTPLHDFDASSRSTAGRSPPALAGMANTHSPSSVHL